MSNHRTLGFSGFDETIGADSVQVPVELAPLLPENVAVSVIVYTTTDQFIDAFADGELGGNVISLSVEDLNDRPKFDPPVRIVINVTASVNANTTYACCHYDFKLQGWLTGGCSVSPESTETSVVCLCSHLTNFAVLLDHQGLADSALSQADRVALGYITQIGLPISVFLMGLTVIFYLWFRVC